MNELLLKEQLQTVILQSMEYLSPQIVYNGLKTYKESFGADDFFNQCASTISQKGPLVSLICLNCSDDYVDEFLSRQLYSCLEIIRIPSNASFRDIIEYISKAESKYICFCEPNHYYDSAKIFDMVSFFEQLPSVDSLIAPRNFIDSSGTVIANGSLPASGSTEDCMIDGALLLQNSINANKNMYGNLSTLMVTTQHAKKITYDITSNSIDTFSSLSFLYHLLMNGKVYLMYVPPQIISTILQPYKDDEVLRKEYEEFVISFSSKNAITVPSTWTQKTSSPLLSSLPKEITFFYTTIGEYYNLEPIAAEADKRGYKVIFTQNIVQKAEIGVYCQHGCFPENSNFSVILLHDLAQRHDLWPNIWNLEHWDIFDLGILPGKFWASLWSQCACLSYANPRCGTYELGHPKNDFVDSASLKHRAEELRSKFNFKYDFSILYAPSWEVEDKEDEFIRALASMEVNLLIKQAHWPAQFGNIIDNIKQMRAMHEGKYENVYYIEPTESILTALELCDIVVSDESSVMAEALMFHKPSIAVIDWLIPDGDSYRQADTPMDYVVKCKKAELREYAERLYTDSTYYNTILEKGNVVFSNQGNVCKDIMDAIEYFTNQKTDCGFLSKKLTSKYAACSMWN